MKCPRCQTSITATPDPEGFLVCPGCGARLRSRSAPATLGAMSAAGSGGLPDGINPNSTLPPGTPLPRIPRPGTPEARALFDLTATAPARGPAEDAARVMRASGARGVAREAGDETVRGLARPPGTTMETLMAEVQTLRRLQEETLALLRSTSLQMAGERPSIDVAEELGLPVPAPVRARRRKTVLLVDDDDASRQAAETALDAAEVPVRSVADGRAALAAIAEDRPDVIAMELDIAGPLAGQDVVNMIKANMEWVDIPILLYTRAPIASRREARTTHGADDFVTKEYGPEVLVSKVVTLFRRG